MAKVKSKFRPPKKPLEKSAAPQPWCVIVTEYEKGWGIRTDDRLEFPSKAQASAYADQYNENSAKYDTPENSYHAMIYPKEPLQKK